MKEVTIVVPIYNEQSNIDALVGRLLPICLSIGEGCEVVFVDDGSRDCSPELIGRACKDHPDFFRAVFLHSNLGQHPAIIRGMESSDSRYVITIDADLQNPPEEIPSVLDYLRHGYDVVGTVRRDRKDSTFRKIASKMVNFCVGGRMSDYGCMLRGYGKPVVDQILASKARERFIPLLAMCFAKNPVEFQVSHAPRYGGESKYGIRQLLKLAMSLLAVKFVRK